MCVRTVWSSSYFARGASAARFDSRIAAQPTRKMALGISIPRCTPL